MAATRRLQKELSDLRQSALSSIQNVDPDEKNMLHWTVLIVPAKAPYNKGLFRLNVEFPQDFPFKPPKLTFATKIYHPNVDEKGLVCLPIVSSENWKPATRMEHVLTALVKLVEDPEPDHPLRADLADEFLKDRKKFDKNAEDFTKKYAEKRP